ncbi:MAG: hypothetical protein ACYTJ0_12635 [Planctomycetota bacterium]|jgi:hypothetical protein
MTQDSPPQAPPPQIDQYELRWPRVIGVLSVIYAAIGMTCATGATTWAGIVNTLPEMFRGGATVAPILQITMAVQSLLGLALAIMLMVGAVGLLRRRPSAVRTLKRWAVLRLGLLLLAASTVFVTGPAQLDMQRSVLEYRNRMLREADRTDMVEEKSDRRLWAETLRGLAIGAGLQAVYPVFIGLYLGRRKITDQVATWE